jgi:ABC-type dipeptide/oligopeptide/nickel transport system ATPase component
MQCSKSAVRTLWVLGLLIVSPDTRNVFSMELGLMPATGCHFHPCCPQAMARCKDEKPALREIAPAHFSACHLNE